MNINIVVILIICVIYLVLKLLKVKKSDDIFLILAFICLFIVLAIRKEVLDLKEYLRFFHIIGKLNVGEVFSYERFEMFYVIYNRIIALICFNDRFFIVVTSIITLIGPYLFIKKHSKNYLISIILFIALSLFHYSFYILRQAIAITYILISIDCIKQKKTFKFILFVIIASLFHTSSLIFLVAYPICNIKNMKIKLIIFFVTSILLFILKGPLLDIITALVYNSYREYVVSPGYNRLILFVCMLIFILAIEFYNNKKSNGEKFLCENEMWISMTFMAVLLQILSTEVSIVTRLADFFVPAFIIAIPNCIKNVQNEKYRNILKIMITCSSIVYIFIFITEELYQVI